MKQIFTISLCTFLLIATNTSYAQNNEVCGFIKHYFDKTPVANVTLYIENSDTSIITDEVGAFCIVLTGVKNKLIIEKEGYFETHAIAKKGIFLAVDMIKTTEQELAISKGLSLKNIAALNTNTKRNLDRKEISEEDVIDISEDALFDLPPSTLSPSRAPIEPTGPTGAAGPPGKMSSIVAAKRSTVTEARRSKNSTSLYDADVMDKRSARSIAPGEFAETKEKKQIKAGRLTAGEIDDFSKWDLWNDLGENELSSYKNVWSLYPKDRYMVQAVTEQGFPIVDATVTLNLKDKTVWTAKTDNTGKAELWNVLFETDNTSKKENNNIKASINYKGIENTLPKLKPFKEGINIITFKQNCNYAKNLDVAFVVDATGSMGDEIDYLKVELLDVIDKVQTKFEDLQIRLGNVFYRDETDAYLTKNSPLTKNIKAGVAFIKDQRAGGGGDFPEAVEEGLAEAVDVLQWSNNAVARILFLVLDAPPHQNETVNNKLKATITKAAKKGIRIVPIVGSGVDKSTEYLLRSCALSTNGHYVFLTDHSGIGGSHLKPSTDSYDVKNLNDLLVDIVSRYVKVQDCDAKEEPTIIGPEPNTIVKISPNPNDGRFIIESTTDLKELFITDANGKILVRFTDFFTGQNQVDIANFPTGTYYIRYEQAGEVITKKVIKR